MKVTTTAALLVVVMVACVSGEDHNKGLVVDTDKGRVEGLVEETLKGRSFHAFYGIPFAKPPLGSLRFKDPQPSTHWMRVWKATKAPPPCLQSKVEGIITGQKATPENVIGSENCLFLNVFTPSAKQMRRGEALPVMVFIHGGGFVLGSAGEYLPHALLDHDVVLVVIQYRLGVFGFLSTEDEVMPGNLGLKDQTLALQWVQNNIQRFGGDKTRVTIFGESAGGASAHLQMLAPSAKGLFSRVIMMSGTAVSPWNHLSGRLMKESVERVREAAGCSSSLDSNELLTCLQEHSDPRVLAVISTDMMKWYILPFAPLPRVDGDYLPDHPAKLLREGRYHQVDLMAGVTDDDGAFMTFPMFILPDLLSAMKDQFSSFGHVGLGYSEEADPADLANKVYEHYLGGIYLDLDHADKITQMFTDVHFGFPDELVSQHHVSQAGGKHPTFRFNFNYRGEVSTSDLFHSSFGKEYVIHGDDLLYLFVPEGFLQGMMALRKLESPKDLSMRDLMTKLWVNFATTGNPTPDDSLGFTWEAATPHQLSYLEITSTPTMKRDHKHKMREFHTSLDTKVNRILFGSDDDDDDTQPSHSQPPSDEL